MAKEPQDRDEAKRSRAPNDAGGAAPFGAGDRFKKRDANEEAPRVQSAADDDASEEWILVDDDLVAAAAEADAEKRAKPDESSPTQIFRRKEEANQLVDDMKQAAADYAPATPFDLRGDAAEPVAAAPEDESAAIAPLDPQAAAGGEGDEALAPALEPPTSGEPALASDAEAQESEPEPEPESEARPAPRVASRPRRSFAAAAGILIAAALGAGGWYAWKTYGSRFWPSTDEVASAPTNVVAPAPKPVAKPTPKQPTAGNPPAKTAPDVAAKAPTPSDPKAAPNGASIPVIPINPSSDPTAASAPKVPTPAPTAKPASSKPVPIVNTQLPIRPAKPLDTAVAKSTAVKKNDTVIELKNGHTLRGSIKRVKDDQITLGVKGGEYTFALSDVKVLDSSAPEYRTEAEMPAVSIVLKSGQRMRGKLLKTSAERVVIVVDHGELVIDRSQIREVSFTGRVHF